MKRNPIISRHLLAAAACLAATAGGSFAAEHVELKRDGDAVTLVADGKPLRVKGAGGSEQLALLAQSGGNAIRTWGVGDDTQNLLDDAQKNGVQVVLGVWLDREEDQKMDYNDLDKTAAQFGRVREAVEKYKDHPAVLAWAIGNEMEGYKDGDNAAIWSHIEACAALVKRLDPNHPTMTVTAEVGGRRVASIHRLCPSIDIMGINSYGGVASIPQRYRAAVPEGYTPKPYLVTEYGPPGTWEIGRNGFDAPEEMTSTAKGELYAQIYEKLEADKELCLGSFAFTWGAKREATSTWFGMFLHDGSKLAAVDDLAAAWGGKVTNHCPTIEPLKLAGGASGSAAPGATLKVTTKVADPDGDPLKVQWTLAGEQSVLFNGGETMDATAEFPDAISAAGEDSVTVTMPQQPGIYRLYAVVHDGKKAAATANVPLQVTGTPADAKPAPAAEKQAEKAAGDAPAAKLPLVVYGDDAKGAPYEPSGYMGETASIKMDPAAKAKPHSGPTALRCEFDKSDGWGAVAWQSPANDWGAAAGGFDLSKAKTLSFWAKGDKGGEKVAFGFGGIGKDQPYFDTAEKSVDVTLTPQWKRYEIDLSGADLSRIKSGFKWALAGQGKPVVFWLDDVKYE